MEFTSHHLNKKLSNEKFKELASVALKKGVRLCGSICALERKSGISRQTLTNIAKGKSCSHATRLKLEAFVEEIEQKKIKPFKGAKL